MATTTEISAAAKELDGGMMIRRAMFLLILILLTFFYLGMDFRGLSHPRGMEQAAISREMARSGNFTAKSISPAALNQINEHYKVIGKSSGPSLHEMPDTFHAPLNPMLNGFVLGWAKNTWKYDKRKHIYTPDILIAGVAMVLLLCSIGVTYLLVSRIFDTRIGGVTAFLMLLCELLWRYSQSGLPQMLMLFMFSFATYFLYKAVENAAAGKSIYIWICLAGTFLGLLALTHWITIWIFLGVMVFAAFYFRPKGIHALILFGIFGLITALWASYNLKHTGEIMGAGRYEFYSGMNDSGEGSLLRDYDQKSGTLSFKGFWSKVITNVLSQTENLVTLLGGILVAPLFFLSLLHPFKRKEIADFRWCLLAMWVFAALGMSIFGLARNQLDGLESNNLHILFIPLFTAYGLAFISVLWNRLNLPMHVPIVSNGHFILAIILSAMPFLLNLPMRVLRILSRNDETRTHYPYYVPKVLASLNKSVDEKEIIVSDIPWAVAWYADRTAIWLPQNPQQFNRLAEYASGKAERVAGIFITPMSVHQPLGASILMGEYSGWKEVILRTSFSQFLGFNPMQNQLLGGMESVTYRHPVSFGPNSMFLTEDSSSQSKVQTEKENMKTVDPDATK